MGGIIIQTKSTELGDIEEKEKFLKKNSQIRLEKKEYNKQNK